MEKSKYAVKKLAVTAVFTALSLITFLIENAFPPLIIPGAKMGLANIFSFAVLIIYGPWEAFAVIIARTVLGAVFSVNPSMLIYSFSGGVIAMGVSAALMYAVYPRVSVMAVSIAAAVLHNVTQNVVYIAISQTPQMLAYMPYLMLLGILSGVIVGAVTILIFKKAPRRILESAYGAAKTV